jgi:hypothetical protein
MLTLLGCDEGLTPRQAPTTCPPGLVGICGTVKFRGALPDSTEAVYLVAYVRFPTTRDDLFLFKPFPPSDPLPLDSVATSGRQFYLLPLPSGSYAWVLAAWKKVGTISPTNADSLLREAGYYRDPADSTKPGTVVVSGTGTDSIDFVVDFSNMHPVSFYFP